MANEFKKPKLAKAKARVKEKPDHYKMPTAQNLSDIKKENWVLVAGEHELFWVVVEKVKDEIVYGYINSDLDRHNPESLKVGDKVEVPFDSIMEIIYSQNGNHSSNE